MSINLTKGAKIDLSKEAPGLNQIAMGLGWDPVRAGSSMDIDASVFMLKNDQYQGSEDLVSFSNKHHKSGAVNHSGDNLTGAGAGDDETILVDLSRIPSDINRLVFIVNIYGAKSRNQNFGMVDNAYIRIVNQSNKQEVYKYNLSDDYAKATAIYVAELYRHNGAWKFGALGDGSEAGSISEMISGYRR